VKLLDVLQSQTFRKIILIFTVEYMSYIAAAVCTAYIFSSTAYSMLESSARHVVELTRSASTCRLSFYDLVTIIILNNIRFVAVCLLPGAGGALTLIATAATGAILGYMLRGLDLLTVMLTAAATLAMPHSIVEFLGYATSVYGSMLLLLGAARRDRTKIMKGLKLIGAAAGLIVLAAFIESTMILATARCSF